MPREKPFKIIDGKKFYKCTGCKNFKPIDNFALSKRTKTGIQSKCKECRKKYYFDNKQNASRGCKIRYLSKRDGIKRQEAESIIDIPEKRKQKFRLTKDGLFLCRGCGQYLSSDEFYKKQTLCKSCYSKKKKKYNWIHKEEISDKRKIWREKNIDKIIEYNKKNKKNKKIKIQEYIKKMSDKYGYNRDLFHKRAAEYVRNNGIEFKCCTICGNSGKIVLHHPSYEDETLREYIVPLCPKCHKRIHNGRYECPAPIRLTSFIKNKQDGHKKKYIRNDSGGV